MHSLEATEEVVENIMILIFGEVLVEQQDNTSMVLLPTCKSVYMYIQKIRLLLPTQTS